MTGRAAKTWTTIELKTLRNLVALGLSGAEIARQLQRSRTSVINAAGRYGVKLTPRLEVLKSKRFRERQSVIMIDFLYTNPTKRAKQLRAPAGR